MKHENKLGVPFSESVIKNSVGCHLAEKSPWRPFRFARKHHYLGNDAWWRWSYYRTLIGNYYRPSEFRHWEWYTAPFSEDILMTSCSVCKKNSLSRKRCMLDENLLWSTTGNNDRPFRIRHYKLRTAPHSGYNTMTSFPVSQKTSLSRKRCMIEMKLLLNTNRKPLLPFRIPSLRVVQSAFLAEIDCWRHFLLARKPQYLGNGVW